MHLANGPMILMTNITWKEAHPNSWTALRNDAPICTLKRKDIGGYTASWTGDRLWAPPSHLPKAMPQPTRFFSTLDEAKSAVEEAIKSAS